MKKLLMILLALSASVSSYAAEDPDAVQLLNTTVKKHPYFVYISNYKGFLSDRYDEYVGRNENKVRETYKEAVTTGSNITRSTSLNAGGKHDAAIENLETSVGELVQKVEDDRIKKSKIYQDLFDQNKVTLESVYNTLKNVIVENLGSEQDPHVAHAFKCRDLVGCNQNPSRALGSNDPNSIVGFTCPAHGKMYYDGNEIKCPAILKKMPVTSCKSGQYTKLISGGTVCVNYIYVWVRSEFSACVGGRQSRSVECKRKKNATSTLYESVSDTSKCLGRTPPRTRSCV